MDYKLKEWMFWAACGFVLVCMAYFFITIWVTPKIDLTTAIVGIISLLIGYYWGTSKSSSDKEKK